MLSKIRNSTRYKKIQELFKKNKKQIWYLPYSEILEEMNDRSYISITIILICIAIFTFLIWASLTEFTEVSQTFGEIVPANKINIIQPLYDVKVKKILTSDGEHVKKGQILVIMDTTADLAEFNQLKTRQIALSIDKARLIAFINNKTLNLEEIKKIQRVPDEKQLNKMLEEDKIFLEIQNLEQSNRRDIAHATISHNMEEIQKITKQIDLQEKKLILLQKEENMYKQLRKKEYISERDYLRIQGEVITSKNELNHLKSQLEQAKTILAQSESNLTLVDSSSHGKAMTLLDEVNTQLNEIKFSLEKLRDKIVRSEIKSPIDGTINGLNITVGSVILSGRPILSIVPDKVQLQVETKLKPDDVGHVRIGDSVNVKVLTYDYSRYGTISGKLIYISATTFKTNNDDKNESYYKAYVELDQQYMGPDKFRLLPGMTVEADVITGKKSLLQYLLKPVRIDLNNAFHER